MILKIKAPATPQKMINFLFLGTKFAAIKPMIMALSAASIISIKIIWDNIKASSIKIVIYNKLQLKFQFKVILIFIKNIF